MATTFIDDSRIQVDQITNADNNGSPSFPLGLTVTGPINFGDGSAASPSITFAADTNTGLFRKTADSVGFSAAGIEIGNFSVSGAWSLGSAGSNISHIAYGNLEIQLNGSNTNYLQSTEVPGWRIGNSVTVPVLSGLSLNSAASVYVIGSTNSANDIGTAGVLRLDARRRSASNAAASITTRPIIEFTNNDAVMGSVSPVGSWVLGPTSAIGGNTFPGNLIIGRTNGTAVPAGYIGERVYLNWLAPSMPSPGTIVNTHSVTLTPGRWMVTGGASIFGGSSGVTAPADNYFVISISTTSATEDTLARTAYTLPAPNSAGQRGGSVTNIIDLSVSTVVYATIRHGYSANGNAGITQDFASRPLAIRIA
jgi:hypothetical protein